jgi:cobalamin synthase
MITSRAKIGGHTGDTLGFTQKIAELSVLMALASS